MCSFCYIKTKETKKRTVFSKTVRFFQKPKKPYNDSENKNNNENNNYNDIDTDSDNEALICGDRLRRDTVRPLLKEKEKFPFFSVKNILKNFLKYIDKFQKIV